MSRRDDLSRDMAFLSSTERTERSERLITALSPIAELPDESARVARLLTALRSPTASDGAGEQEAVASIAAAITAAPISLDAARRSRMRSKVLTAKVAVVAGAVFLMGTGAAAATGTLPAPAQRVVSDALDRVDVSRASPRRSCQCSCRGSPQQPWVRRPRNGGGSGRHRIGDARSVHRVGCTRQGRHRPRQERRLGRVHQFASISSRRRNVRQGLLSRCPDGRAPNAAFS